MSNSYEACIDDEISRKMCCCDNCGWEGLGGDLEEVVEACLMPGDPSPAGRCPECDALAYLVAPDYGRLVDDLLTTLIAVRARLNGDFNNRALVIHGPLSEDKSADIMRIITPVFGRTANELVEGFQASNLIERERRMDEVVAKLVGRALARHCAEVTDNG